MRALLLALLLAPIVAPAADWIVTSIGSYHLERGEHCEVNPGLGVEVASWVGGFYRNSDCKLSLYAGQRRDLFKAERWTLGLVGIAATGYEKAITLAPGAMLTYEAPDWGLNLVLFPSKEGRISDGVIGLQLKWRWQ